MQEQYYPAAVQSSIETFIPKVPGGKYIGFLNGAKLKASLRRRTFQVPGGNAERVDIIWPESAQVVAASFILGLFFEQLRGAETLQQFKAIIVFKSFKFDNALAEAYRIARAVTQDQAVKMVKSGTVPTIP